MKTFKKCMMVIGALALTASLSACGNNDSGNYTVSDALNSNKMLPIVVTDNNKDYKDHVVWAGYIGKGKVKAMFLDGMIYDFGYKDLKKLSNEKYNRSLKDMGNDYDPVKRKYVTSKTNAILKSDESSDSSKAEAVSLDFKNNDSDPAISSVKGVVSDPVYSKVGKKSNNNDEWATIKSTENGTDYEDCQMHIKVGKGTNLKLEDIEKTTDNYDNVEAE